MKTRDFRMGSMGWVSAALVVMLSLVTPAVAQISGGSGSLPATNLANRSGTLTLGGTAQPIAPANSARRGFCFQNQSSGDFWLDDLATAVPGQPSLWLPPGAWWCMTTPSLGNVSVYGATTGQAFYAREW